MFGSTSIRSTVVTGQTEGLKVGCVGKNKVFIKPLALGWFAKVDNVFLRLGGFAKVDNSFGYEKWTLGGSIGFFSSLTIQRFFLFFHDIIS